MSVGITAWATRRVSGLRVLWGFCQRHGARGRGAALMGPASLSSAIDMRLIRTLAKIALRILDKGLDEPSSESLSHVSPEHKGTQEAPKAYRFRGPPRGYCAFKFEPDLVLLIMSRRVCHLPDARALHRDQSGLPRVVAGGRAGGAYRQPSGHHPGARDAGRQRLVPGSLRHRYP
jgi:hypothetical protein